VSPRQKLPIIRSSPFRATISRSGPDSRINVRLPGALRVTLEIEARSHKRSLNEEIVSRLRDSVLANDQPPRLIAKALLSGLDDAIVQEMLDIVTRDRARDELADMQRKEEQIERGLREESGRTSE
jgi:Arc-like DNA binding domain